MKLVVNVEVKCKSKSSSKIYVALLLCKCVTNSLAKLETLELRENMLRYLPSSMSRLVKLRSLDLGDNLLEELVSTVTVLCLCVSICMYKGEDECIDTVHFL